MRLPRVRVKLSTLLFAVALVAGNLWGFRRFYETEKHFLGSVECRVLPAGVGGIPLFNVALIGTVSFAARRLGSPHRGGAANAWSALSGVGYFSLHFLLLAALVSLLMPDAVQSLQEVLDLNQA